MGFKSWATGEILTATELMNYLMKQVVIVCTSSTRPASPTEGMHIYETDTDRTLRWDGSAWSGLQSSTVTASGGDLRTTGAGGAPRLYIKATDAPADEKVWDFTPAFGNQLLGRVINDAEDASDTWLTVTRVGAAASLVQFDERVMVTGGLDVEGSPSGYPSGEVRFPTDSGSGDWYALSTAGQSAPTMSFDHRGGSNTGEFVWRNSTDAASERMRLTGGGVLRLASQPGSALEDNRVDGYAQMYGRGFAYASDSAEHQAVTAGIAISVNRAAPAAAFNNAGGDPLRTYSGSTQTFGIQKLTDIDAFETAIGLLYFKDSGGTAYTSRVLAVHDSSLDGIFGPNGHVLYVTHA